MAECRGGRLTELTETWRKRVRVVDASVPAAASPPTQPLAEHTAPVWQVLTGTARSGCITLTVVFVGIGSHYSFITVGLYMAWAVLVGVLPQGPLQ